MHGNEILWTAMTSMAARNAVDHVVAADGNTVRHADGRTLLSGNAGLWNCSLGFSRPEIRDAIIRTMDELPYASLFRGRHDPALQLAGRLLDLCPDAWDMARVVYACSGSSAVDTALRFAHRYHDVRGTRRSSVAALAASYHGSTTKAQSVTGENLQQEAHGVDRTNTIMLDVPGALCRWCIGECQGQCVSRAIGRLEPHVDDLAALIVEPILGSAGVVEIPSPWLADITRWAQENGVLVIADEVATGFGRTGSWFAWESVPVGPDLVVCSKAINAGYLPLAAIMFSERVTTPFEDLGADFVQGETQAGNPMACSAGVATIDVCRELDLLRDVDRHHETLVSAIRQVEPLVDRVGDPSTPHSVARLTGRGLMIGVHLNPSLRHLAHAVRDHCLRSGVIVHPSALGISLFPPLVIDDDDLHFAGQVVGEAVSAAARRGRVAVVA